MTWRTTLNDENGSPAPHSCVGTLSLVEEVCGWTDPVHQQSAINDHVHHRQLSLHKQPRKQRAGALMLPSSCLDGSIARGPTRALFGGCGWLVTAQHLTKMSPNSDMVAEPLVEHSSTVSQVRIPGGAENEMVL